MPLELGVWRIDKEVQPVKFGPLDIESRLEDILEKQNQRRDFIPWLNTELLSIFITFLLLVVVVTFIKVDQKRKK